MKVCRIVSLCLLALSATLAVAQHSTDLQCQDVVNPAGTQYNAYTVTSCPATAPTKINSTPLASCHYIDSAVIGGHTKNYVFSATNGTAETGFSNCASAVTPMAPPTNLTGSVSSGSVVLNWTLSADSSASNLGNQTVYRGTGACDTSPTMTQLAILTWNTTTYTDSTVSAGGSYCWGFSAKANTGVESAKATISETVLAPPTGLTATPQ